jgi:hypothetical protein
MRPQLLWDIMQRKLSVADVSGHAINLRYVTLHKSEELMTNLAILPFFLLHVECSFPPWLCKLEFQWQLPTYSAGLGYAVRRQLSPERVGTHCTRGGWTPAPICKGAEISPSPGFEPRTVQLVASRYTIYAIPALIGACISIEYRKIKFPKAGHSGALGLPTYENKGCWNGHGTTWEKKEGVPSQ